jgi:hypothetical protein
MNTLKANEGKWLTQNTYLPIEERGFFKELTGIKATSEYYREATDAEVAEWEEYKSKQEEFVA